MRNRCSIPASSAVRTPNGKTTSAYLLAFGLCLALFAYFHAHPQTLDPTMKNDQVLPLTPTEFSLLRVLLAGQGAGGAGGAVYDNSSNGMTLTNVSVSATS